MSYKKSFGIERDERPFNFAEMLLQRCDHRFNEANESAVEGDPFRWYRVLNALRRAISFVQNEKGEEDPALDTIKTKLSAAGGKLKNARKQNSELFYFEIEKSLDDIEVMLVKLMYKHELYYPHYSKKMWQEKAKQEDI
jgi:hypothetical protein